jgi:hypothetical protein
MLRIKIVTTLLLASWVSASFASLDSDIFRYRFYAGITGGYGATTWSGLVPPSNKANAALALSTPISVREGGAMWGLFAGYEFIPEFAFEFNYTRYAPATVYFSDDSLFTFENNGRTQFTSQTESVSFAGKFMVIIPRTLIRAYSSVGVAGVHRFDVLENRWRVSPSFGLGVNYNITPHVMGELGTNYTGGYGQSELTPANDYVPFLYSVFFRLAYRF